VSGLLDQLPALVGVVVGTLGTVLATGVSDRARWRRSQSVRWDERRLAAYADYGQAIKEIHLLALHLSPARTRPAGARPVDRSAGLEQLTQADARRSKAWEAVLLLGDSGTVTAAGDWREAVQRLAHIVRGTAEEGADWPAALKAADLARDRFYAAARGSLAVGGGSVAQAPSLYRDIR